MVGGEFSSYNGVAATRRIIRLNPDGSLDSTFNGGTGANSSVMEVVIQENGKILIGGYFTAYNGVPRNCIARPNTDGSLDTTFDPGTGADYVQDLAIQSNGKIVIGGYFSTFNGINRRFIARLNADGSLDDSFDIGSGANGNVDSIAVQPNGKVFILRFGAQAATATITGESVFVRARFAGERNNRI